MISEKEKRLRIIVISVFMVVMTFAAYTMNTTFAWFSDNVNDTGSGISPKINVDIVGYNSLPLTTEFKTINYTGAGNISKIINVKSQTDTNVDALVRIMIVAKWPDQQLATNITFNLASSWLSFIAPNHLGTGSYAYYNNVLPFNQTNGTVIGFLESKKEKRFGKKRDY